MNIASLSGGVVLIQNDEHVEHFIIVKDIENFDYASVAGELAQRGLEIIPNDECPAEYVFDGVKIHLANIGGIETPAQVAVA